MTRDRIYHFDTFDYEYITNAKRVPVPVGNPHGRKKIKYKNIIAAFDIETSKLPAIDHSFMYIWQVSIDEYIITGRTWKEFFSFLKRCRKALKGSYLVFWVHNLSYEFQFLKGVYSFEPDEVFAMAPRKILKCEMFDAFEFRCSYYHTNMRLETFLEKMGVPDKKLKYDYDKIRYPWDELTPDELAYCINDVRGLTEAIRIEMQHDGDTLYTVPLTSTGYVRRDMKAAMARYNHKQLFDMLPDAEIYLMLRDAFRGGDVHANRYYVGDILEDVKSDDASSDYPDKAMNRRFPMSRFTVSRETSARAFEDFIFKYKKAVVAEVAFYDIEEKNRFNGRPYLSDAKCRAVCDAIIDNGRIISASYLETTITDVDYRIIKANYNFKMRIIKMAVARYGQLPEQIKDVIREYYRRKTELKNVEGQEIYYEKSKNKLNATYGCMVQDPCKDSIDFVDSADDQYIPQDLPLAELISKNNKRAFLNYAWGVWITAWARYDLDIVIRKCADSPDADYVYCDTDSVKYLGTIDLTDFNEKRKQLSIKSGAYADDKNGVRHYMGVFEHDGDYKRFCTLGAKKYVYEDEKGIHTTIAGVSKKYGPEELKRIENFKEGFIFKKAGGTGVLYNDHIDFNISIDGHPLHITDNIVLYPDTYELGIAGDYKRLLEGITEIKYSAFDMPGMYKLKRK